MTENKKNKTKTLVFRARDLEFRVLKAKAMKFNGGNYSDFLRDAILNWEPDANREEKKYAKYLKLVE